MDSLKKYGAVFSAHYEKIILSVILLALLAAAALLPFRVAQNREMIRQALELGERTKKKEREPVDTDPYKETLRREKAKSQLELSGDHNLFNPVVWKRSPNGKLIKVVKGDEDGPGGLVVSEIRPLHLVIEYDGVVTNGDNLRYQFTILDETKPGRNRSGTKRTFAPNVSQKSDLIIVTKLTGPPDNPSAVEFRFADSTETATITKEQPYSRIAGYEADLVHEKMGTPFKNVRTKQSQGIRLGTQTYNIVAITKDEVTVQSSTSNKKRWTVRRKGAA
jgi:hypothetical protein